MKRRALLLTPSILPAVVYLGAPLPAPPQP